MRGLRLSRIGAREGRTDFPLIFEPIMETLGTYEWLLHDVMFSLPSEWEVYYDESREQPWGPDWEEFDSQFLWRQEESRFEGYMRVSSTFLARYSRYFVDDGADLYGSREAIRDPIAFDAVLHPEGVWSPEPAFLEFGVDVFMRDVDAGAWEIFSRDADLLRAVSEAAAAHSRIRSRETSLV